MKRGDLGFSVIIFTVFAVLTLGLILVRRKFGGELGGPRGFAIASGVGLCLLWLLYVALATAYAYGFVGPLG